MNTDAQSLAITEAPTRIQLGEKLVSRLGAGGDHHVGQKAAEECSADRNSMKSSMAQKWYSLPLVWAAARARALLGSG